MIWLTVVYSKEKIDMFFVGHKSHTHTQTHTHAEAHSALAERNPFLFWLLTEYSGGEKICSTLTFVSERGAE